MSFWNRLFGRKSADVIDTPEKLAGAIGATYDTYTGRRVTAASSMQMTTVFACVRVLAESVGMLPCQLMQLGDRERRPATTHPVYQLLAVAPNDYMTPQEFWELLVLSLALRGNFYAYKVKTLGKVSELLPINPASVVARLNDRWEPVYEVTFRDGSRDVLGQDDIWHVRLFTLDGLVGLSPVGYARQAIALGLATEEHGARLFKNGAVPSGVLRTEQRLSDEAYTRLKKDFQERHQGVENNHRPLILEMGLDWKTQSLSMEDSQFLETRQFQRDEICAIFRVPPHLVANLERATFSNIEHQALSFVSYSLVPYLTRIEQRVRAGLLRPDERSTYYAKFNAGAFLRGDMKSRFDAYASGINWGILSPNECRELEDRNPRDGGDLYLTPMNMTTRPEATDVDKAAP